MYTEVPVIDALDSPTIYANSFDIQRVTYTLKSLKGLGDFAGKQFVRSLGTALIEHENETCPSIVKMWDREKQIHPGDQDESKTVSATTYLHLLMLGCLR